MSFSQLGYPQYLSTTQAAFGSDRTGDLSASSRTGSSEIGASQSAAATAVTSVLGMYANPYAASNYGAFLPCNTADLALFSQMGTQYELKDSPGTHPFSLAAHAAAAFYPYGHYQYGDPARVKSATRETTSTLKAWLQEHKKNPYPTKGEKIMLAIITKMTLTQVSTWFANARRRLKKENKVTWGRSAEDRDGKIFDSDNEGTVDKNEDEEIDLESIDIDENIGDQSNDDDDYKLEDRGAREALDKSQVVASQTQNGLENSNYISANDEQSNDSNKRVRSPSRCQPLVCNKPKIWSLAETATCPDTVQKSGLSAASGSQALSPLQHPAFLRGNGIYTCQIGKLHNWTSAAFLGQSSLSNVKSFLGLDEGHYRYSNKPDALRHATARTVPSVLVLDCDDSQDSPSPKHRDHEKLQRATPAPPIKSSFQHVDDRTTRQQETQQLLRPTVLTALTST